MKTKTTLIAAALILGIGFSAATAKQVKELEPPTIKLLPLSKNGMLRLLVANNKDQVVKIYFYEGKRLLGKDRVQPSEYDHGFLKRYDLNKLDVGTYTIEIITAGIKTEYELELMPNKKVWARYWDSYLQKEQLVALR